MPNIPASLPRAAAIVCAAMTLGGCTLPSTASSTPPTQPSAPSSSGPTHDSGAAASGIDETNPPTPVGVVQVACAADSGLTRATIGVLGVQRRGQVAIATFVVTGVRDAKTADAGGGFGSLGRCAGTAFDPQLVDGVNLVSYTPLKADIGQWLRTNPYEVFPDTTPSYLAAIFPAPKPGVTTIDVLVGAGSVANVAVS